MEVRSTLFRNNAVWTEERAGELHQRLADAVRARCPGWLVGQVDDIIQAAYLKVAAVIDRSEGNRELPTSYLWKAASSAVIDEIRHRRRLREVSMEESGVMAEATVPRPNPEHHAYGQGVAEEIRGCLGEMVDDRRAAVSLHLLGHSVPEVARLMHWNEKRAENLVYRGLADLRRCLKAKGIKP